VVATTTANRALGLPTSPRRAQALIALFGGTLMTLVTGPPGVFTQQDADPGPLHRHRGAGQRAGRQRSY
jgi:hypothetical protein